MQTKCQVELSKCQAQLFHPELSKCQDELSKCQAELSKCQAELVEALRHDRLSTHFDRLNVTGWIAFTRNPSVRLSLVSVRLNYSSLSLVSVRLSLSKP